MIIKVLAVGGTFRTQMPSAYAVFAENRCGYNALAHLQTTDWPVTTIYGEGYATNGFQQVRMIGE